MTKIVFLNVFFLLLSSITWAAVPTTGSVSTATGGTGRGTPEAIDGVPLNPGMVGLLPTKFLSANYTNEQWGITISDNGREALFPAALSFTRSDVNNFKTQQVSLAVAYAYKKLFGVGANVSLLEYEGSGLIVGQKYRQSVGDIGFLYSPMTEFGVGLVFNKVASSKSDVPETLQKQKTMGLGGQFTYQNFIRFRFDMESGVDYKTERLTYMGGIETFMNDWVVFRFGYQNNNVITKNYSTVGLGFSGPQFGLHYAYISNVANNEDDQHSIDLGIPF